MKRNIVLGIHIGHDASCALVSDGELVSAIQQERITKIKHDGSYKLSNILPINECLKAGGYSIEDVNYIVSSFQNASPGGVGLNNPVIDKNFDIFDPLDKRHYVISHHLAHAYCAIGQSKYKDAAIIISDLGGSSTIDGKDYFLSFAEWQNNYLQQNESAPVITENLSIYTLCNQVIELKEKEYCIPHSNHEAFICSPASLYENISYFIFHKRNTYGQLMALAAYADKEFINSLEDQNFNSFLSEKNGKIIFKNNWQNNIKNNDFGKNNEANLAYLTQRIFEHVVISYVQRARKYTDSNNLTASGGIFLNILLNSKIKASNIFSNYFVPSAPNDSGISIGCAFYGLTHLCKEKENTTYYVPDSPYPTDKLGIKYHPYFIQNQFPEINQILNFDQMKEKDVAKLLSDNKIIARCTGRFEFGPRALGNRSLLGSPLSTTIKETLNLIKGRQSWRPVAPIVIEDFLPRYFEGPLVSPYMNYSHIIKDEFRNELKALWHPDYTTRAQTLTKEEDDSLYQILKFFYELAGYGVLVNTSLNGKDQPIISSPIDAVKFFIKNPLIYALIVDNLLITRKTSIFSQEILNKKIILNKDVVLNLLKINSSCKAYAIRHDHKIEIPLSFFQILSCLDSPQSINQLLMGYSDETTLFYQTLLLLILEEILLIDKK